MRSGLRRFLRDETGATALEFGLVVGPFIFMMFAVFEYAMLYLVTLSLDNATMEVARRVRTGEYQQANITPAQFKANVCAEMGWLQSECPSQLSIDVRTFPNFASQNPADPVSNGKFDNSQLQFSMGGSGDIVLVRCFYQWRLLTPVLQAALSNAGMGIDVVTARAAFRNEPF